MSRIFSTFLMILWALWFGGTIALFIFVVALFRHDRPLAITAAPVLFLTFERYHLILGTLCLLASGLWMITTQSRIKIFMLIAFMAASACALISSTFITPHIMDLRQQNRTQTDEFKRAHGQSSMIYTSEAVLLLLAGVLMAIEMTRQRRSDEATTPRSPIAPPPTP